VPIRVWLSVLIVAVALTGCSHPTQSATTPPSPSAGTAQAGPDASRGKGASTSLPDMPPSNSGCAGTVIDNRDIAHKNLGTVRVFLVLNTSSDIKGRGCVSAVTANGSVLPAIPIDISGNALHFADPVTDATGNSFITYNPGRYTGVLVLVPTATGFDDIGWSDKSYGTHYDGKRAYYNAQLVGPGPDGNFVIRTSRNDCLPNCAQGKVTNRDLHWNGADYVQ
jgi:hypothetical protein